MEFTHVYRDEEIREAKMYSVSNALNYGLEKAIILSTGARVGKLDTDKLQYYFPEIKEALKHIEELKKMGLVE